MMRVRTALSGWGGGPGLMTAYFTAGAYTATEATDATVRVHAYWAAIGARWPTSTSYTVSHDVDVIDPATGDITDTLTSTDALTVGSGGSTGGIAPPASQALVALTTSTFLGGRRLRGRSYIGPLPSAEVSTLGELSAAAQSAYQSAAAGLIVTTGGIVLVVWHRPVGGAGGTAGQVTSATVRTKLAVLRSRRD